jgi:hypothetical protein
MRKRSKYKPKPVQLDNFAYVMSGFVPVASVPKAGTGVNLGNMAALDAIILGHGTGDHAHTLREAFRMAVILPKVNPKLGADWLPELTAAKDAVFAMHARGERSGRFLFTGPEMQAVKEGMAVHTQQLEECTVKEMERALVFLATTKENV